MKEIIKLNSTVDIDLQKLLESKALLQANSGGGKSWLIRRILEQSHGKVQQIVIDPEGEFSTLREKFDYVLAGKGGDTPADPRSAALLARKLLELNVSAIIDLYELPPQDRKHFVRLFVDALVNAPKELWHPVLIVIDEAHVFVPEKDQSEAAGPINDLASRGRKRGFGLVLATQRISKLAKDSAAECNNKLIGRTSLDIDMKRAAEELGMTSKEEFFSLRKIAPGNFLAFGPAISDEVISVKVGPVETSHPKAGSQVNTKVVPPTAGIRRILGKLADLPKEAQEEAHTIAEYRSQITSLKRELTVATQKANTPRPEPTKVQRIEIPTVGKKALEALQKSEKEIRTIIRRGRGYVLELNGATDRFERGLDKLLAEIAKVSDAPKPIANPAVKPLSTKNFPIVNKPSEEIVSEKIGAGDRKVLIAIAQHTDGVTREQLTLLTGYRRSTRDRYIQRIRQHGFVNIAGDRITISQAGIDELGPNYEPLPTGEELRSHLLRTLPEGEKKILSILIGAYPQSVDRDEITNASGYQRSTRDRYLQYLKARELIQVESGGMVKAAEKLFT